MWEETCNGNFVLTFDEFYISYNPHPILASSDETAIVIPTQQKYLILNGDFRRELEEIAPRGLPACLKFFAKKIG